MILWLSHSFASNGNTLATGSFDRLEYPEASVLSLEGLILGLVREVGFCRE